MDSGPSSCAERWTYDDLLERFEAESIPNCGVAAYRLDEELRRLVLVADGDAPPAAPRESRTP